jgi:hypothetical protein
MVILTVTKKKLLFLEVEENFDFFYSRCFDCVSMYLATPLSYKNCTSFYNIK